MIPILTMIKECIDSTSLSMEAIYDYADISRQGYFQAVKRLEKQDALMTKVSSMVLDYRQKKDRRAGSRSLYYNLDIAQEFGIGINKFERLMSEYGLTLAPMNIRIVTTKSSCQSWNYKNLISGRKVDNINQVVVGDLTYLSIGKHSYYLFCLTDIYSARIVGYHLAERMRAIEAKEAFSKWICLRGQEAIQDCIHHTDGGTQYFSRLYLGALQEAKVQISVADNCLENGYAEQRNGLIKHHLIPTLSITTGNRLRKQFDETMEFYNLERKQKGLGWLSPSEYEQKWQSSKSKPTIEIYSNIATNETEGFERHTAVEIGNKKETEKTHNSISPSPGISPDQSYSLAGCSPAVPASASPGKSKVE